MSETEHSSVNDVPVDVPSLTPATIAGITALAAFAVAVIAGVAAGNNASSVLVRAIIAMMACYPIGMLIGVVAGRVVKDHIERHREANPAPQAGEQVVDVPQDQDDGALVV